MFNVIKQMLSEPSCSFEAPTDWLIWTMSHSPLASEVKHVKLLKVPWQDILSYVCAHVHTTPHTHTHHLLVHQRFKHKVKRTYLKVSLICMVRVVWSTHEGLGFVAIRTSFSCPLCRCKKTKCYRLKCSLVDALTGCYCRTHWWGYLFIAL